LEERRGEESTLVRVLVEISKAESFLFYFRKKKKNKKGEEEF
jgi:hypothetical protein